jgi:hypothetical protein
MCTKQFINSENGGGGGNGLHWPVQHTQTEIMYSNRYAKYTFIF